MPDGNTGKRLAYLAGGIAAGVIGSRLLPPIVAMGGGALRARRGSDPFEMLIADHRRIDELLGQMETVTPESNMKRTALFLMVKRKLAKHALAEEDVVYPILHNRASESEASKHLYDEHADIKIHLFELEQQIKSHADWSETVRRLRSLIAGHVREEEERVFPKLREMLSGERQMMVSGNISREEAMLL